MQQIDSRKDEFLERNGSGAIAIVVVCLLMLLSRKTTTTASAATATYIWKTFFPSINVLSRAI